MFSFSFYFDRNVINGDIIKNLLIKSLGVFIVFSTSVFAVTGKHASIASDSDESDNGEICVFCHTPHAANSDDTGPRPLWNKPSATTLVFKMYGAIVDGVAGVTIAGTPTDTQPAQQTLACLSCHDGVSAMNSVINAPGSGSVGTATVDGLGRILISSSSASVMPNDQMMAIGGTIPIGWDSGSSSVIYSSYGDLNNDHPLSIEYIEGRASLRPITDPVTDIFGAETVGDMLRGGKVHCASCHDPHGTGNDLYLRNSNVGSALCFACHDK